MSAAVEIRPVTSDLWDDAATVFRTRGDPARCWCQWFRMRNAEWRGVTTAGNRAAMAEEVRDGARPPGVLAYSDGAPVGWCRIGPRPSYARLVASTKVPKADIDDESVWALVCLVVRTGARRQGVAAALVDGAIDFARASGARAVEAYPVDVSAKASASSSELYHGTASTFAAAGFREIGRTTPARPIVRLDL